MAKQQKRKTRAEKIESGTITIPLSFESPESSLIRTARYDPDTLTLLVEFTAGKTYGYSGITADTWASFAESISKGKHFNTFIRPYVVGRLQA